MLRDKWDVLNMSALYKNHGTYSLENEFTAKVYYILKFSSEATIFIAV